MGDNKIHNVGGPPPSPYSGEQSPQPLAGSSPAHFQRTETDPYAQQKKDVNTTIDKIKDRISSTIEQYKRAKQQEEEATKNVEARQRDVEGAHAAVKSAKTAVDKAAEDYRKNPTHDALNVLFHAKWVYACAQASETKAVAKLAEASIALGNAAMTASDARTNLINTLQQSSTELENLKKQVNDIKTDNPKEHIANIDTAIGVLKEMQNHPDKTLEFSPALDAIKYK